VLYGRDAERTAIGTLLDAARASKSGALVIRGEPGAGKTALLEDTRERASDMHVLSARGVQSESELPFAGLHQLLRPALDLFDRLPAPQAVALRGALGLDERSGDDRFLIAAACLTLLSELAERRPVLCLVDDAQWLDGSTTDALLFSARRLDAEGIVMLFGLRDGDHRFEARELDELELGGLEPETAAALIDHRTHGTVAPAVRDALVAQSGGNALALVELPVALTAGQLAGSESLPETLPLTRDVERLFLERVRALPDVTQRLLWLIAADDTGLLAPVLRAAAALGIDLDALNAAEQSGLVSVHGLKVEVRHPLVRSAVYHDLSSANRRAAHLALADALDSDRDSDRRAWHRAAAAQQPDADVAAELEITAERARLRSGHAAAAAALERAAELSIDTGSQARRLVSAADAAWHAGQPDRATALLDQAGPIVADTRLRADLNHLRGVIEWRCGSLLDASATLIAGATEIAPLDSWKALEMLFDASMAGWDSGDFPQIAEAGRQAARLPAGDDDTQAFLAAVLVGMGSQSEAPVEMPHALTTLSRAADLDQPRWLVWAAVGAAVAGDSATEATLLRRAATLARTSGAVDTLTLVLEGLAVQGFLVGNYAVAAEATEGLRLATEAGLPNAASLHLAALAWLAAVKGDDEECRSYAAGAQESARSNGAALAHAISEWAVALLDLGIGRCEETVSRLAALNEATVGAAHPFIALTSAADLVEAAVRSGQDDVARAAYATLEQAALSNAATWELALAARCRGLLSTDGTADGDFEEALRMHSDSHRPFDEARTELLVGEHLRRKRERVESRAHLRAALDAFETLGAVPWAERARVELRASGETARKRDPSAISQLTPQELQVARFVGEGFSNKEVAAKLFLSPRTIDSHLRSVFAKLGVTSRTQLARLPLGGAESASGLPATA
jgi:DNA-binding NarL/FixJ family response regulator